ncbi:MAG: hypothetical protein ACLQBD_01430 [Syntrophobacteraceae bacterium]
MGLHQEKCPQKRCRQK